MAAASAAAAPCVEHVCNHCHHKYACPCAPEKGPFQEYHTVDEYERRLYENAEASVVEERSNAIPRTTVAISIFFFCTGFQWVAHQLSNVPEECYDNPLCSHFGRLWNVKNWNGVFASVSYEVVGWCLLICYASRCCSCCGCFACARCSPCKYAGKCCCDSSDWADVEEDSPRANVSYGLRINACIAVISHGLLAALYAACPNRTNQVFIYIGLTMVTNSFFLMEWCKRHPFALSAGSYAMFFAYVCIVITLDNVGTKGDQSLFKGTAWFLAFFGWIVLLPRYFMLLHFGIPNLIPSMDEREKMHELTRGEEDTSASSSCSSCGDAPKRVDNCIGCSCFFPLCRVLSMVDMKMRILCLVAFLSGLAGLVWCWWWRSQPLSFVIMMESSWILLFYVVTCHWVYLFRPDDVESTHPEKQPEGDSDERAELVPKKAAANGDGKRDEVSVRRVKREFVIGMVLLTALVFCVAFCITWLTDSLSTRPDAADISRECTVLGWFDQHDLWNLLSGVFLMLFILSSGKLDELHAGKQGLKVR